MHPGKRENGRTNTKLCIVCTELLISGFFIITLTFPCYTVCLLLIDGITHMMLHDSFCGQLLKKKRSVCCVKYRIIVYSVKMLDPHGKFMVLKLCTEEWILSNCFLFDVFLWRIYRGQICTAHQCEKLSN